MKFVCLFVFCLHGIFAQQYEVEHYNPSDIPFYYEYDGEEAIGGQVPGIETFPALPPESPHLQTLPQHGPEVNQYETLPQQQQQTQQEEIPIPNQDLYQTEPTEPGPLDCREEQYPCTRLYSVHKPCKQCLNEICFYSLRRMYVINKEICIRTVCAHEELLRADLCRDKFSRCGVMASSGMCNSMGSHCSKSCGGC
ncbi:microfibrillar-associated 2 [Pelobates cultripes]|uniref:Microfibrillar-associated 2 n=1 Tax=Pelobates cultripes TaxID=61616 RepID=A0AAD1T3D5_PELCU|nr:microfibrillar-associated 2 [Pelobates cultripes]